MLSTHNLQLDDIKILRLDYKEDIFEQIIEQIGNYSIAIISDRCLIEYIHNQLNDINCGFNYVDIDGDYDEIYIIKFNVNGNIDILPIDRQNPLVDFDYVCIDMDGVVSQDIIDDCTCNNDNVILFGISEIPLSKNEIMNFIM